MISDHARKQQIKKAKAGVTEGLVAIVFFLTVMGVFIFARSSIPSGLVRKLALAPYAAFFLAVFALLWTVRSVKKLQRLRRDEASQA